MAVAVWYGGLYGKVSLLRKVCLGYVRPLEMTLGQSTLYRAPVFGFRIRFKFKLEIYAASATEVVGMSALHNILLGSSFSQVLRGKD